MRIALAQINATVGDFAGNLARIRDAARGTDASLVVFPELALSGYMPRDLLLEDSFVDACAAALAELAADHALPPLLVGAPVRAPAGGKPLWNAAVLVRGGRTEPVAKRLLPTYDVFDERRYFRPGEGATPVDIDGTKVGVTICEDAWTGPPHGDEDPVAELVAQGAEVIVNLSASPWFREKTAIRRGIFERHAIQHGVPVVLVNLVGGNDQLIFDGGSFALDANGGICAHAAFCAEDLVVTDLAGAAPAPEEHVRAAIVLGLADYFQKTGFARAIVGLSGGIDSSLVACLAAEALGPENVLGVGMPGPYSAGMSLEDARAVAEALGIRFETVPVSDAYDLLLGKLQGVWGDRPFDTAEENLQARLRGTILMSLANKEDALVLVPSNKSELAMGYCTLYGDMVGALAPVSDLYKTEVYALAREFPAIPARVFDRPPTAELAPDQTDQDTLPPYETLDPILRLHLERRLRPAEIVAQGFDEATVARVLCTVARFEFKRQQAAPVLKLTEKAFGLGRRFPIVERFRGGA